MQATTSIRLSSNEEYASLLDKYDTWMFDCDGVLWCGDRLVDGAIEALTFLQKRNKKVIFVTNDSSRSRKTYKAKFDALGIEVQVDDIYGSAYASAIYLSSIVKLPIDKKVYVIGSTGIEEELREEGISFIGGTDAADCTLEPFSMANFTLDPDVAAVLTGCDMKITFTKLAKAFQYLTRNPGCLFLASNEDRTHPTACYPGTTLLPAAGAISAPLRFALNRAPLGIGKPSSTMLDCIRAKVKFDPERTIMVGDRLDTDIMFGKMGGLSTLLVMTGVTTKEDLSGTNCTVTPEYITGSVGDLRKADI